MKVYITGMGAVCSLGLNVDEMFKGLLEGKTGVKAMPDWRQYNGLNTYVAAPVPDYDAMKIPRQARRSMSRMSEMAVLATLQALQQADLPPGEPLNSPRVLMIMGSTSGSPATLETYFKKLFEKKGPEGQFSTTFFKVMNHSVPANVATALGFNGSLISPSCACATSAQAMIMGWELIRAGLYDVVIAGGADELHYISSAVFDVVQAASRKYNDSPDLTPRPFDKARDGLVVSEGAGIVVMESDRHAQARGARPLAEFLGGAYLCDGSHMSQSSEAAMTKVINLALDRVNLHKDSIDYVNAHATGTLQGDPEEAQAIANVFKDRVPVSSLKAHLGHSLAACGALEVIASVKMMQNEVLIPTRNLLEIDPSCAGAQHLRELRSAQPHKILSNNFAFGGMNTSLVISKTMEGAAQ